MVNKYINRKYSILKSIIDMNRTNILLTAAHKRMSEYISW